MTDHLPPAAYPRFHLAFPVTDLAEARRFYGERLGCAEGRSSDDWVDFDFKAFADINRLFAKQ